jgi:RimJ/RimL family protein N-acetyltransferase
MTALMLPIRTPRLSLVVLTADLLALMSGDIDGGSHPFDWPSWWPDDADRRHLEIWRDRASGDERNIAWGPRALIDADLHMVGHAGFHLPPRPLAVALDDPRFVGQLEPIDGAVEIGYTIFPRQRSRGYATEAVAALVDWAARTSEARAVLAAIVRGNDASERVLERVGGFGEIGTCRNDTGEIEVVYRRDLHHANPLTP